MKRLLGALLYGILGALACLAALFLLQVRSRPDLSVWHLARLEAEYSVKLHPQIVDFSGYMALEERLFQELGNTVYQRVPDHQRGNFNRYHRGAWSDSGRSAFRGNRSYELAQDQPRAGFLLLHGLSDSPYSLMTLGRRLHREGAHVLGLRLPGHGTAPGGLTRVSWRDFTAAVRLAARHLALRIGPEKPLYLVGYSNGAALSLEYALSVLEGEPLSPPAGLVLISPAVAVTPTAVLARGLLWLSRLPGLEKLAWLEIGPEYDPYKYNSFAVNAGEQVRRLTGDIRSRIEALDRGKGVAGFPPVLAFVSAVDATVSASAVVNQLMARLPPDGGHQLVLFDVNRESDTVRFLSSDPGPYIETLMERANPFDLSLVTNRDVHSRRIMAVHKPAGQGTAAVEDLDMAWPPSVYSLSHVALPFPADDPLYGAGSHGAGQVMTLGTLEPRGERNLLRVKTEELMRLRYNPFYRYLESRVVERLLDQKSNSEDYGKPILHILRQTRKIVSLAPKNRPATGTVSRPARR